MIRDMPDFRALVEFSLKLQKHEELEHELHAATFGLKDAKAETNALRRTVRNLENKLKGLGLDPTSL